MKNYDRTVTLHCPTCAGTEFSFDEELPEEMREYNCTGCDGTFSYQSLLEENAAKIEGEVDEIKDEIVGDLKKQFSKLFK